MRRAERRNVNVLEMKCLRNLVSVSRMDRVRNKEVRRRAGIVVVVVVVVAGQTIWPISSN